MIYTRKTFESYVCLHKLSSAFGVGMEWQSGMIFRWIGWPGANFDTTHRTNSPPIIGFNLQHLHGIQFFDNENSFIEWNITYTINSPFGFAKGGNDLLDCVWVLHQRSAIVFNVNYQSNKAELSIFWDEHLTSKVCVGVIVLEWTLKDFCQFFLHIIITYILTKIRSVHFFGLSINRAFIGWEWQNSRWLLTSRIFLLNFSTLAPSSGPSEIILESWMIENLWSNTNLVLQSPLIN